MNDEPKMPVMPPCRVSYETPFAELMFASQEELDNWLKEPFWKKLLGLAAYDKRLKS